MVLRRMEMREIGFKIPKNRQKEARDEINKLYGLELDVILDKDMVWVKGDLHNYKKRNKIIFILSGGELGENL